MLPSGETRGRANVSIVGPAGRAVDLERAAEHPDALPDPDDAEPAALRGAREGAADLEAVAVVGDRGPRSTSGASGRGSRPSSHPSARGRSRATPGSRGRRRSAAPT